MQGKLRGRAQRLRVRRATNPCVAPTFAEYPAIASAIAGAPDAERALAAAVKGAARLFGARRCAVAIIRPGDVRFIAQFPPTAPSSDGAAHEPEPLPHELVLRWAQRGDAPMLARADDELDTPEGLRAWMTGRGVAFLILAPFSAGGAVRGCLMVESERLPAFDRRLSVDLAQALAAQVERAIEQGRLTAIIRLQQEQIRRRTGVLDDLITIRGQMRLHRDPSELQHELAGIVSRRLDNTATLLLLVDEDGHRLDIAGAVGVDPRLLEQWTVTPPNWTTVARLMQPDYRRSQAYVLPPAIARPVLPIGDRDLLLLPLLSREDRVLGLLVVEVPAARQLADVLQVLEVIVTQAAVALESSRLNDGQHGLAIELSALYDTAVALSSQLDLPVVLETIVQRAVRLVNADTGALYLLHSAANELELTVVYNLPLEFRGARLKLGDGLAGRAGATGRTLVIADYSTWDGRAPQFEDANFRAVLAVPLLDQGEVVGVLDLLHEKPGVHFEERDIYIAKLFAAQAAVAVRNARLYASIEQRNVELQQANRVKSEFIANMSHELRTPMNSIIGYTGMLLEGAYGELSPSALDPLQRVKRNAVDLLGQINDLLDLSKIEAGRVVLEPQSFLFADLIASVTEAIEPLALQKGLGWTVRIGAAVPRMMVADSVRLRQVLVNLLGNAVKFTRTGAVELACSVEKSLLLPGDDAPRLVYRVSDTGIGIPSEQIDVIWEAFHQVDGSPSRGFGGTGLGLTIVRRLVELMGGTIAVQSEPGKGTTFTVVTPIILPPPVHGIR